MLMAFILAGIFTGVIIPTILISVFKTLTIRIIELMRFYKKGSLSCNTNDFISGSGYHRQGMVYVHTADDGIKTFVPGQVYGYLLAVFVPLCVFLSSAAYIFFKYCFTLR